MDALRLQHVYKFNRASHSKNVWNRKYPVMWISRNDVGSKILKTLVLLLFFGNASAFMLALQDQISGVFNVLGWTNVSLYLLFAFGYGYFQLILKGDKDAS